MAKDFPKEQKSISQPLTRVAKKTSLCFYFLRAKFHFLNWNIQSQSMWKISSEKKKEVSSEDKTWTIFRQKKIKCWKPFSEMQDEKEILNIKLWLFHPHVFASPETNLSLSFLHSHSPCTTTFLNKSGISVLNKKSSPYYKLMFFESFLFLKKWDLWTSLLRNVLLKFKGLFLKKEH